jgi:hypothetical protein
MVLGATATIAKEPTPTETATQVLRDIFFPLAH